MKSIQANQTDTVTIVPESASLIVTSPTAIVHKCLTCGGVKDVYMLTDQQTLGWMHSCKCHPLATNEDVLQLLSNLYISLGQCATVDDVRRLIVAWSQDRVKAA